MRIDINKILRGNLRSCKYGAPLGDNSRIQGPLKNLRVQRVKFEDGDYGPDGTYWGGGGDPLYCAFNDGLDGDDFAAGHGVRIYIRAESAAEARELLRDTYPGITFARGGR